MKSIPTALKQRQENQRLETVETIRKAIKELVDEGYILNIKIIMERTGLSRSVFAKDHVKEILKGNNVGLNNLKKCEIKKEKTIRTNYLKLENENSKMTLKLEKIKKECEEKSVRILKIQSELALKKEECEILRGKLHILMQRCRIKGLIIEE